MPGETAWPELNYADWAPTKKTLQMVLQMLGKARLALAPSQPEWLNAALYLDARGFVTGAVPVGERLVSMGVDVFDGVLWVSASDGRSELITLGGRCVAEIWQLFSAALTKLGVEADIWTKPQELADTTSFAENTHDCTFVPQDAQRFHALLSNVQGVFEEFRSGFFGRSGVQFWWGGFDLAVLLFNGEHAPAPDDRGYIMRYDLDAEHLNAGFWPGDENAPAAFYAYLHPQPPGCALAPIDPSAAAWVEQMGEWMLPYEAVRTADDPRGCVVKFLRSAYAIAGELAGWDLSRFEYVSPQPSKRT
ncbi:MAG: DUF5996 family protein [Coriobacteriia bacterium]|nr:DUF5996 family protein [Coriobacteriia bacterium]